MRALLLGLVFISPPCLKKLLLKVLCRAHIGRGAHIGWFSAVMGHQVDLAPHSIIRPCTLINVAGQVHLGRYTEISSFTLIYGSSNLIVGDNSYIGPQVLINADEPVHIGHGSALGPRSMVFTHGSFLPVTEGYWTKRAGVALGDKVWCAAGGIIHPGVEIGDNSFVNAMSVVTHAIPPGSVAEGHPARVICAMERVQRQMPPRRLDFAATQLLHDFCEVGLRRELRLGDILENVSGARFHWRGRAYYIGIIPSTGNEPENPSYTGARSPQRNTCEIYLVNCPGWVPPQRAIVFDLTSMRMTPGSDPIQRALQRFAQRYYGVRFQDKPLPPEDTEELI